MTAFAHFTYFYTYVFYTCIFLNFPRMRNHSHCANEFAISVGIKPTVSFIFFPTSFSFESLQCHAASQTKVRRVKKLPSSRRARQRARLGIYQEHQESPSLFDELSSLEIHFARDCRMAGVNGHRQPGEKGARGIRGGFRCA